MSQQVLGFEVQPCVRTTLDSSLTFEMAALTTTCFLFYLWACSAAVYHVLDLATQPLSIGSPRRRYIYAFAMLVIYVLTYYVWSTTARFWTSMLDKFCGLYHYDNPARD